MNENNTDRGNNDQPDWHAMQADDVLSALGVSDQGLSRQEAQERLDKHGPNKLPGEEKPSALRRFVRQFQNLLIYILIIAAVLTGLLGEWVDTAVILLAIAAGFAVFLLVEAEKALVRHRRSKWCISPQARQTTQKAVGEAKSASAQMGELGGAAKKIGKVVETIAALV